MDQTIEYHQVFFLFLLFKSFLFNFIKKIKDYFGGGGELIFE